MNAAKVTLTSTILAAALGLALGLSAAPGNSYACHKDGALHGNQTDCDNGGGGIVYTAKLTGDPVGSPGAFEFMCHSMTPCNLPGEVIVTPNTRENELRSMTNLDMDRPNDAGVLEATWNDVFNACDEILGRDSVEGFFVDDWRIAKAGGVRVIFRDIELEGIDLQGAEVRVQLIGKEFDFIVPFLPAPGNTSVFDLVDFEITGTPVRGKGAIKSCRGSAGGGELMVLSTLEITATASE